MGMKKLVRQGHLLIYNGLVSQSMPFSGASGRLTSPTRSLLSTMT
jgi:hypothetical protein